MRIRLILYTFSLFAIGLNLNAQADFISDIVEGCAPMRVNFIVDTAYDISTVTVAEWDFGNGQTLIADNPSDTVSAVYIEPRRYTVRLTINNDPANAVSRSGYINTHEPLNSDFALVELKDEPEYTYSFIPDIDISQSAANYTFVWEPWKDSPEMIRIVRFADSSNPENALIDYTYADTGLYNVHLTVREVNADYFCESTTIKNLLIAEEFIVPNVYSPDNIDYYIVDPENSAVVLSFKLFARTGMKVFEQEAPIIYWDGRNSSGQDLQTGVYFYVMEATVGDIDGYYTKNGFIHLFRGN